MSGLYSFKFNLRTPRTQQSIDPQSATTGTSATDLEMLSLLRGVRADRLRSIYAGSSRPVASGYSLRLIFGDLPSKLLRR